MTTEFEEIPKSSPSAAASSEPKPPFPGHPASYLHYASSSSSSSSTTTRPSTFKRLMSCLSIGSLRRNLKRTTLPIESRGHTRVLPDEKLPKTTIFGYLHVLLIWFSLNLAANNVALGMLGPGVFALSFRDAAVYGSVGAAVGSVPVAWIAGFGPLSGCRTLIFARYTMGWWPNRVIVLLNIVLLLGYSMIDCVVAGQILSAVSGEGRLSIAAGMCCG